MASGLGSATCSVFLERNKQTLWSSFLGLLEQITTNWGGLKETFFLSQLQRPEGQSQGVSRALLLLKALGKNPFLSTSFWWWQQPLVLLGL